MKTIIAGSRSIDNMDAVIHATEACGFKIAEVVSGKARGVDSLGEAWANWNGIPIKSFPAMWNLYGRSAGYKRNEEMANYADALIAIWDGSSPGTKHMIDIATKKGLRVYVYRI